MKYLLILPWLLLILAGCQPRYSSAAATESDEELPEKLSELGLFIGEPGKQIPATGVHSYELRTPLFSDYTLKYRFIKLPDKGHFEFRGPDETLWFPEGTIIAKTFAYPVDQRNPELGHKLLETRILRKQGDTWQGASYVWNDEQTDAQQKITGKIIPSSWIHTDGSTRQNDYIVPNANQCKGCHGNQNEPIGPKPRNLLHAEFARELLSSSSVVPLAIWNHPDSGSLHERAKAWLDINCAHCHNPSGPARQSGLDLRYTQNNPTQYGVLKAPVAAGRGSGGRHFDIVPGKPDESIMVYRLESTEPGIMMPELPRRMVDEEGLSLIREWISSLSPANE